MSIGLRIKELRNVKKLNQLDFADKIGIKQSPLSQMESGKILPSIETLSKIIRVFNISYSWLIDGEGDMFLEETKSEENSNKKNVTKNVTEIVTKPNVQKIVTNEDNPYIIENLPTNRKTTDSIHEIQEVPLYDLEATAGLQELFSGGKSAVQILDTIKIPHLPKCDGAISITGDSMYPLLKSGDMVLYKEIPLDSIFYGEMYLLSYKIDDWEEYVTVKYVQKSDLGDEYLKLVSQNQHHQPKDVLKAHITAIAIIKASIRINTMM